MHWLAAVERPAGAAARRECSSRSRTSAGTRPATPAPRWSCSADAHRGAASAAATSRRRPSPARGRCSTYGADARSSSSVGLTDKARTDHGRQCCGGEVTLLLEPLPVVPSVAVFGVGHVGLELARVLAGHDLDLHLVDSRAGPARRRAAGAARPTGRRGVRVHHSPVPELALGAVPRRHPRPGDDPRPRRGLRPLRRRPALHPPRIGRADRLGRQVGALPRRAWPWRGTTTATIDRIRCPIGLPGPPGKVPAAIAVSVAAELLDLLAADRARTPR